MYLPCGLMIIYFKGLRCYRDLHVGGLLLVLGSRCVNFCLWFVCCFVLVVVAVYKLVVFWFDFLFWLC